MFRAIKTLDDGVIEDCNQTGKMVSPSGGSPLSHTGFEMIRNALAAFFLLASLGAAHAQQHEVPGTTSMGVGVAVRLTSNEKDGKTFVTMPYRDNKVTGNNFAHFYMPTKVITDNESWSSDKVEIVIPLPRCDQWFGKYGKVRYQNGVFDLEMTLGEGEIRDPRCIGALPAGFTVTAKFQPVTEKDRLYLGIFSDRDMANCNLVHGTNISVAGIEGKELTFYPNGSAHDADGYYTYSQLWADMTVNTLVQTGPESWQNNASYVFLLGDKVVVQKVLKAPKPGISPGGSVRTHIVEVKRKSDGLVAAVDLQQLYEGSLNGCLKERLVYSGRQLIPGIFVKIKPNVRPVFESSKLWVNDPVLRYGFCQDFNEGRLHCQTREYGRADLAPSSWTVGPDEFDVVTDFPYRGQRVTFNRPGGGTITHNPTATN